MKPSAPAVPQIVPLSRTPVVPGGASKVAVALRSAVMDTVQGPVPAQAPLQPAKVEPAPSAAVSVTLCPSEKLARQLVPAKVHPEVLLG